MGDKQTVWKRLYLIESVIKYRLIEQVEAYMLFNITPKYLNHKKIATFCFLWFFVRLSLLYIILKVGQDCSMGKFQISKLNIFVFM